MSSNLEMLPPDFKSVDEALTKGPHFVTRKSRQYIARAISSMPAAVQDRFVFKSPDAVIFIASTDIATCAPRPNNTPPGHTVVLDQKWFALPYNAQVGALGHELAHIEYYRNHGKISETTEAGEMGIDAIAASWGIGEYLVALFQYQLTHARLDDTRRAFTQKRIKQVSIITAGARGGR